MSLSKDVAQALRSATAQLSEASPSPRADAELLLAHALEFDRSWLVAHGDECLSQRDFRRFEELVERRKRGEPVAYAIGEAWFCGRAFEVNPSVLIPRPETEHLVEGALAHLRRYEKPLVLDVGTGSGAIACTLASELPNAIVYATEKSPQALAIAERNGVALCHPEPIEGHIVFELADLLPRDEMLRFDCVVANLPYVPSHDVPDPPDPLSFEPREALDGGADGLCEYRRLLSVLPERMNEGALVLLEAAPPTIAALHGLASAAFRSARVTVGIDYAGLDRYLTVDLPAFNPTATKKVR